MSIKLSFCIPTFNRAKYIGHTIDSIINQANCNIEIIIVDGASSDNTEEVVQSFQKKFSNITYYRAQTNNGVDLDMAKAVELAQGEYCWLMSSDDIIKDNAINIVLNEIISGDDIYLCDIFYCNPKMKPWSRSHFLRKTHIATKFDITDKQQFLKYIELATSNNALFCYMSAIIFLRNKWRNVKFNPLMDRTGYAHVFTLFSFRRTNCTIKYIPIPLVLNRPGNDSFSDQGLENRYLLDFNGYLKLAELLFSEEHEIKQKFLSVMTKEHPWYRLLKLRSSLKSSKQWENLTYKLLHFGYRPRTLKMCGYIGSLYSLINLAVFLNVYSKKTIGVIYKFTFRK